MNRTWTAVLLAAVVWLTLGAAPAPAVAQSAHIDQMLQGPELQGGNEATVAERYPLTHYRFPFHADGIGIGARSSEAVDITVNEVASFVMLVTGWIAQGATKVVQWAFDESTTAWLVDGVEAVVVAISTTVWGGLLLLAIFAGALWVAWTGVVRQRATSAAGGVVWMVAVVGITAAFLAQPRWFVETPNEMVNEVSSAMFGAVAGIGTGDRGGYYGDTAPTFSGPASTDAQRRVEDELWRVMVYLPWRIATFPTPELADEYGERLLADRGEDNVADIYDEIGGADEEAAEYFAGRSPGDRLLVASGAFLASLLPAITLIVLGASLIVLSIAFVLLSMLAPLFALVGTHPGSGRNAFLGWLDMWLGTLVKRIAVTALISVLMALLAFAASSLSAAGWFQTSLMTALVCVAALLYRKTITDLLASAAGRVGSGEEGKREHQSRQRPGRSTMRAARAVKYMGVGGAAVAVGRKLGGGKDDGQDQGDRGRRSGQGEGREAGGGKPTAAAPRGQEQDGGQDAEGPSVQRGEDDGYGQARQRREARYQDNDSSSDSGGGGGQTRAQTRAWRDQQNADVPADELERDGERQAAKHMRNDPRQDRPKWDPNVRTGSTSTADRPRGSEKRETPQPQPRTEPQPRQQTVPNDDTSQPPPDQPARRNARQTQDPAAAQAAAEGRTERPVREPVDPDEQPDTPRRQPPRGSQP